ncbi:MAG: threonine--tRNA ligase [Spirochaetota bacterium]|nr:threonine--tRNA ligase [Spirochaetota bacterium]
MSLLKFPQGELSVDTQQTFAEVLKTLREDRDLAKKLGVNELLDATIAVLADGIETDLSTAINNTKSVEFLTPQDSQGLAIYRHSMAHLMGQALIRLRPGTKAAIGPIIKDGFYYDFDIVGEFGESDLPVLHKEMIKITKESLPITREVWLKSDAIKYFTEQNDIYKVEILNDIIKGGEPVTIYKQGEFLDLCRGVHVPNTRALKFFKLQTLAGAYWRGSENNKMLTRIYGTAWASKEDLDSYLENIEEAKKRDHRKLGKELKLFGFHEEGLGLPFWYPNGMVLKNEMLKFMREELDQRDYIEIETPTMLKTSLWETSGHMENYKENMFFSSTKENETLALKPMNCPGGIIWYNSEPHSYKELPLRVAEFGKVHRYERSGQLNGLIRVRGFTQDDAHVFMTPEQIEDEIVNAMELVDQTYATYGFDYNIEFSTRPDKSIGSDEMWALAEKSLKSALDRFGKKYTLNEGDGAFYGPKIDYHLKDALGRTHQCGTIQLDMNLPERFGMTYTGSDGAAHILVMIHRAIYGSLERFAGILIEHFGGKFPVWLAPIQVRILSVSEKFNEYGIEIRNILKKSGIRTEIDKSNEKLGYKIRQATMSKVPYIIVLGEKEMTEHTVSPRHYTRGEETAISVDSFIQQVKKEIHTRTNI